MRPFIPALLLLLLAPVCEAVGIRVQGDLKVLRESGFDFEYSAFLSSKSVFALTLRAPGEFEFDSGGDVLVKPFAGVSFVQTANKVKAGPKLLGAPSSRFALQTGKAKDGCHECRCRVLVANAATSYLVVAFMHARKDGGGDWPLLVYIPVSKLIEQLSAEEADAG